MRKEPVEYLRHIADECHVRDVIVWDVVANKIPELEKQITTVINNHGVDKSTGEKP